MKNAIKTFTVIDLGSTKISAVTAGIDRGGRENILATEISDSRGITGGNITDMNKATQSIKTLVEKLRKKSSIRIKHVFVTVKGTDIEIHRTRGMVFLSKTPREISRKDLNKCAELASIFKLPLEKEIIEVIPSAFYIDGSSIPLKDPLGLYGVKLGLKAFVATANRGNIGNITKCIDHSGLILEGVHLSGLASGASVLEEDQKDKGVLLLDVGDISSEAVFFRENMVKQFGVINMGVSDILSADGTINDSSVSKFFAKAKEILAFDKDKLGSIVITGGGALLEGVLESAEKTFNVHARMGLVKNEGHALNLQDSIVHTSTIGLVRHLSKKHKASILCRNPFYRFFTKFHNIYDSYF